MDMNVRMGYINIPIDYVRELKNKNQRAKARAFVEYFDDMDREDINSFSFYAKAWGISKTQTQVWIKEFKYEIERFFSYWLIKNSHYYNSVKKSTDRKPTDDRPIDIKQTSNTTSFEKTNRPRADREPTEVFNINNNNIERFDKNFEDMFFRCRFSYKYVGNKKEAFNEYQNHQNVSCNDMAYAYMLHVNDPQINGKVYNLTNFMKNQAYLNYLQPKIQIQKEDKVIVGFYDQNKGTVTTDDNVQYSITKEKFAMMVANGEIIITKSMKVA